MIHYIAADTHCKETELVVVTEAGPGDETDTVFDSGGDRDTLDFSLVTGKEVRQVDRLFI